MDTPKIRLDKLNIPAETLRQSSSPAADKKLKRSLQENGVLVPLVVSPLGKGEYAVALLGESLHANLFHGCDFDL